MNTEDKLIALVVVAAVLIVGGAVTAVGAWGWQNAQDKRQCRQHGGTVVDVDDHRDWHCVGATPERGAP